MQDPFRTAGSRSEAGLLLAGALVVVIGFADDRWGLSAISKLAGQVAAAGILVWSGQALPWLPLPNGGVFSLEPDLSVTLTILLVVVTMNAINFIDGLDGLAAGIVAVAALSFLVYSYTLIRTIHSTSQSLPAVASALLAGMCIGFLPHNFYPARIFMGDIGAMLLGLLLAYGPISSTGSLDPALLTNYSQNHTLDRFPTFLPLLVPAAIFIIPYADLMFAIIRRTRAGKPIMAADRQHLHHRLLNIGHSYRQSVLIMYLWAALFSVTVVSLSIVRTPSVVFIAATAVAVPGPAVAGRPGPPVASTARRAGVRAGKRAPSPPGPAPRGRPPAALIPRPAGAGTSPPAPSPPARPAQARQRRGRRPDRRPAHCPAVGLAPGAARRSVARWSGPLVRVRGPLPAGPLPRSAPPWLAHAPGRPPARRRDPFPATQPFPVGPRTATVRSGRPVARSTPSRPGLTSCGRARGRGWTTDRIRSQIQRPDPRPR